MHYTYDIYAMHASRYVEMSLVSTAAEEVATQRHGDSLAESSRCREAVGDESQQDEPYAEEGEQEREERVRRLVAGTSTTTTARGVGGAVVDDDGPGCGDEEDGGVGDQLGPDTEAASVGEVDGVSSSEHGGGHAKVDSGRVRHSGRSGSESRRACCARMDGNLEASIYIACTLY